MCWHYVTFWHVGGGNGTLTEISCAFKVGHNKIGQDEGSRSRRESLTLKNQAAGSLISQFPHICVNLVPVLLNKLRDFLLKTPALHNAALFSTRLDFGNLLFYLHCMLACSAGQRRNKNKRAKQGKVQVRQTKGFRVLGSSETMIFSLRDKEMYTKKMKKCSNNIMM